MKLNVMLYGVPFTGSEGSYVESCQLPLYACDGSGFAEHWRHSGPKFQLGEYWNERPVRGSGALSSTVILTRIGVGDVPGYETRVVRVEFIAATLRLATILCLVAKLQSKVRYEK